jgi:hypothetical protein
MLRVRWIEHRLGAGFGVRATMVTLTCAPVGGGQGGEKQAGTDQTKTPPTWNATVGGLDAGTTFEVQAKMDVLDVNTMKSVPFYSDKKTQKADGKK